MSSQLILCGKMEEKLKRVPDSTYHSLCTDAPYGLGDEPNIVEVMRDWVEKGYHEVKNSGGIMCLGWDAFVPQPLQWKEAYRTLRPGAYGLVACGTRTYDWMVASLRFAGFEIRDTICWHYGQGWPKSLNISKAIDSHFNAERPKEIKSVGDVSNARYIGKATSPRVLKEVSTDEAQTEEAKQFQGYGTALKPATELWVLVRKPLEPGLTVAENVLKWGTGGLNIDACRIDAEDGVPKFTHRAEKSVNVYGVHNESNRTGKIDTETGRFPSNLILDEFTTEIMNQQTGIRTTGAMLKPYTYTNNGSTYGKASGKTKAFHESNTGYPSRFFYCAKPSKSEKNKGLEVAHVKSLIKSGEYDLLDETPQNTHVSVKPISLMRYFVRMVTPAGGTCLDCFAGSGTTGIACKLEGLDCVLIEMEEDKCEIARHRIDAWEPEPDIPPQLDLFA